MPETTIKSIDWRLVEVGRVLLIERGASAGKLATIVEIIDHKRALVDGPDVPRQGIYYAHGTLTKLVIPKLPRAAGSAVVAKKWKAADIDGKWAASSWAQKRAQHERRRQLNDFERFQVQELKKQRAAAVRKAVQA